MERAGNEKMGAHVIRFPVAAEAEIHENRMVALNSEGYIVQAAGDALQTVAGVAAEYVDNRTGAAGNEHVNVVRGVFVWRNDGSISETDILKRCAVKDDCTVTLDEAYTCTAGLIVGVENGDVVVDMTREERGKDDSKPTEHEGA